MSDLARHSEVLGIKAELIEILSDPQVRVLNLTNKGVSLESLRMILGAMQHGMPIRVLNLAGNALGDAGCALIGGMLRGNDSLETLDLSDSGVTCEGAQSLCRLEGHRKLKHLYISNNEIGSNGAAALSLFCTKVPIKSLNLSFNRHLGNSGVESLASALTHSKCQLEQLSINCVGTQHRGIWALTRVLERYRTRLKTLYCAQGGSIDSQDAEALRAAFDANVPGGRIVLHLGPPPPTELSSPTAVEAVTLRTTGESSPSYAISPCSSVDSLFLD